MEVLVGPTLRIDVFPKPPYVVPPHDERKVVAVPPPSTFLEEEAEGRAEKTLISRRIGSDFGTGNTEDSSDSSSSIGAPDDSDEEEDDSVVSSCNAGLGSLDSLEDSLPIKRGLSNNYYGKSKSFANLSDVSRMLGSAKDLLEKPENPFNKRRRILMANKRSRKSSSFYSWHNNPKSVPLLAALNEEHDDIDAQEDQEGPASSSLSSSSSPQRHQEDREKLGVSPKAQKGRQFMIASPQIPDFFFSCRCGGTPAS